LPSASLATSLSTSETTLGEVMGQSASESFFESPHAVTYLLILANAAMFALTLIGGSLMRIDPATLLHYGAIHKGVLVQHEYWRLLACTFLHVNILHLTLNMLCIAAWSGLLEKRLGASYFILVYLASAIGGSITSIYGHPGAFLGVGASGAVSGIVGALLCLTILGKLPLSPQFFLVTIGANVMLALKGPNIDWLAHLGGFTAGFAACALLDRVENLARYWLRCKFPEFVKFGIAAAAIGSIAFLYLKVPLASGDDWHPLAVWGAGLVLAIKLADLILARTKGLAVLAFAFAALYGSLAFAAGSTVTGSLPGYCGRARSFLEARARLQAADAYIGAACEHTALWPAALALIVFTAALIVLRPELRRGLGDVGFIANTFRAERRRRQGL
jgi:rhomboid protease GluP